MNLTPEVKTIRLKVDGTNYTLSAGTSDVASEYVDTANFGGARFIAGFGAITSGAVTSIKVSQCDTSGGSYSDLEGTAQTVADDDDNQIVIAEVTNPRERYLKFNVDRGTQNAVVDFLLVELFNPRGVIPVTQDSATVIGNEIFNAPAEGTA